MCEILRVASEEPFAENFDRREKRTGYFSLIASIVVNAPQNDDRARAESNERNESSV